MDKPIIRFCEPYEIFVICVKENKEIMSYLHNVEKTKNMTENKMLEKYNIDYDSFFRNNIRDEQGYPENLKTYTDVHLFLLNYIIS